MSRLPRERPALLSSYGGETVRCGVVSPRSVDELAALLAQASGAGRRITFRGGGCSMDTQSLNRDLVISLANLRQLRFTDDDRVASVEAGVRWGELVRRSSLRGRVPPVIVTTEQASAAGTVAANCLSRWTPVRGPESAHVQALELVTARGERLRLDRGDARLFAVIGGLGTLGAITRVELPLLPEPHDQVETEVIAAGPAASVLAACAPEQLPADGRATCYGVLLPDLRRGLAYRSRPVSGQRPRPFLAVHQPRSALRMAGELLLLTHTGTPLVGELAFRNRRQRYVDSLLDYTFFMEGDARLRLFGRRLGFALRIVQQSFVVPVAAAGELLARARRLFAAAAVTPMLSDVLYCPPDDAWLSATRDRGGFVISFAFSPRTTARHARIAAALVDLSSACRQLGGRVRLSKHVHAHRDDLEAMYGDVLPRFLQLKRQLDPDDALRNDFFTRVLGGPA